MSGDDLDAGTKALYQVASYIFAALDVGGMLGVCEESSFRCGLKTPPKVTLNWGGPAYRYDSMS
jgi:hypothetical protein